MIQMVPPVDHSTLAEWQRKLDELFPKSEHTTHLKLVWVAGDDWEILDEGNLVDQRIERFYVYEMFPKSHTDPDILFELEEMPCPVVRYDSVLKEVTRENRAVTRLQWRLYRETGYFGKPFWVIQGDKGGHQRFFTTFEKQQLYLLGLPTEPPLPGTLPYAPFDQRVIDKLLYHDRLRQIGGMLFVERETQKEKYKALHAENEKKFRSDIIKFVSDQVTIEDGRDVKRAIRDTAPIVDTDYQRLWEESEQRYVETGRFRA